jgi:hypothetical protein
MTAAASRVSFAEHVALIQTQERLPVGQARWTAWTEGPSGHERRLAAEADRDGHEDQPAEARP